MLDLTALFVLGLLGSAHCVGMCGGFVLALGGAGRAGLRRQGLYFAGKTATYAVLGAAVGGFGAAVASALTGVQGAVSLVAGVLIVAVGLGLLGLARPVRGLDRLAATRPYRRALRFFVQRRGGAAAVGLGLVNGLLPCGLVYAVLAKAAVAGGALAGGATMVVFGAATIPALALTALAPRLLRPAWQPALHRAGGVLVILLGLLTILRATPALDPVLPGHAGHAPHETASHGHAE